MTLEVIYQSENLVAINKPHGLLVHRTKIAADATEFAIQILRDQLGQKVYPVHRLDRKTSGVLLFAKNEEYNSICQKLFQERKIQKSYIAIVRGFTPDQKTIDYPLTENNKTQEATTHFKTIQRFELQIPFGKFSTSRYSLIRVTPLTGRFHQIRKHMAHIFHPIIGDRPHGCNKQNKLWKDKFQMDTMLLHAENISFQILDKVYHIQANPSQVFIRVLEILKKL